MNISILKKSSPHRYPSSMPLLLIQNKTNQRFCDFSHYKLHVKKDQCSLQTYYIYLWFLGGKNESFPESIYCVNYNFFLIDKKIICNNFTKKKDIASFSWNT